MTNNVISFPTGYWLRQSGTIGLEIISPRGEILAWTTDRKFGAFICGFCNEIFSDGDPMEPIFGEEATDAE